MSAQQPTRIAFLLLDGMLATSCTLPMEILQAGEAQARTKWESSYPRLEISTLSSRTTAVKTQTGFKFQADFTINDDQQYDLIYIPGLWRNPRPILQREKTFIEWLKKQYEQGAIISAVGTGCCLPAQAGLLDGKAATTHWHYFDQFEKDFPKVNLKRQYFITQAERIYCAASVNSLADLTIHFLQRFYGANIARQVERHFSHEIRQAYENKAYFENNINPHPDEAITQIQIWLQENYTKKINMAELASSFGLSVRTLNRRFKNAIGKSPVEFLQEQRIDAAKDLLQNTNLNISEISDTLGINDPSYFSILFKKHLGISPLDYRTTVRKKLFRSSQ